MRSRVNADGLAIRDLMLHHASGSTVLGQDSTAEGGRLAFRCAARDIHVTKSTSVALVLTNLEDGRGAQLLFEYSRYRGDIHVVS